MFLASLIRRLSHVLMPQYCIFCHFPAPQIYAICEPCQAELPSLPQHCQKCGQNLPIQTDTFCGSCLTNPPPYHRLYTLFPYETPITQQIIAIKFRHDLIKARAFGLLLTQKIHQAWYQSSPLPDLIIPIPLHPKRLQERGFNQSLEIAKPVSKALSIPLDRFGLNRIRATQAQSGLPAKERASNVKGAFTVNKSYQNLHIALLDDVVTTGNTISEACRILQLAGAKRIDVWCCARRG